MSGSMRGLVSFISRIKNCTNDAEEEKKVEQELAKVRTKLANKGLSGYRRKKALWKLVYITMIGYTVDLGHVEASYLINSEKFSEKITGYIATSILFNEENSNKLDIVVNSIKNDLTSPSLEIKAAVLSALANSPFPIFIEKLTPIIAQIAFTGGYGIGILQKKALVCLAIFLKKNPEIYQEKWASNIKGLLLDSNLGIVLSTLTFLINCIKVKGPTQFQPFTEVAIDVLKKLVDQSPGYSFEYTYYGTFCPWLQAKILQLLQLYPFPAKVEYAKLIQTIISQIVIKVEVGSNINKNNADHSVLFEAINLCLQYKQNVVASLRRDVLNILTKYIGVREPNVRYLALESMARIEGSPEISSVVLAQKNIILISLRDTDPSIRKRALDVLFSLCTKSLAPGIVNDLLDYLAEKDVHLKEELILKIALLAEKFGDSIFWYIDVVIKMLQLAGGYVSNDVWYRIAQILTGFEGADVGNEIQKYAAAKLLGTLNTAHAYEPLVKLGAYVLGEYGELVAENEKTFVKEYDILMRHYNSCSSDGKCMVLSALTKLSSKSKEVKELCLKWLESTVVLQWDLDVQQRAIEYLHLIKSEQFDEKKTDILDKIPAFPEGFLYNNVILRSLNQLQKKTKTESESLENAAPEETKKENAPPSVITAEPKIQPPEKIEQKPKITTLLDIDSTENKPSAGLENIFGGAEFKAPDNIFGNDIQEQNYAIKKHAIYEKYKSKFSSKLCMDPNKINDLNLPVQNANLLKKLINGTSNEGILYENDEIIIKTKCDFTQFMGRILIQFASKTSTFENLQPEIIAQKEFESQISKIKYADPPTKAAMFMVQIMVSNPFFVIPVLKIGYTMNSMQKYCQFGLPVFITKFVKNNEMTLENASTEWKKLDNSNGCIDAILKNPAPSHFSHIQVLMKFAQLLNESFNFYVIPPENEENFTSLFAVGNLQLKSADQKNFPANIGEMKSSRSVFVMTEVEFYPEITMQEFRFSVRSEEKDISHSILSQFKLFT